MNKGLYNSIQIPTSAFTTIVETLRYRTLHQPEKLAYTFLVDGETQEIKLTYQELDRLARAVGGWLQKQGAGGERALLLYPPGLDFLVAFFGCLYAGVVAVPAYPPRPNQSLNRLQAIVNDAQASLVLTTNSVLNNGSRQLSNTKELGHLCWLATETIDQELAEIWQEPDINSDTLAFLQYTSGSTSMPKGVMLTHGNLIHNQRIIEAACNHNSECNYVSWLPLYHDMGLGNAVQPIFIGSSAVLMSPVSFLQRPYRWLQAISQYKAHTSGGPNFAYELCLNKITAEQLASLDLSHWQVAFNGAEPIRYETLAKFTEVFKECGFPAEAFSPCYGLAESTVAVTGTPKLNRYSLCTIDGEALKQNRVEIVSANREDSRNLIGCGQNWLDQKAIIVDTDTCQECPSDRVGEIWVSGPSVGVGYWQRPEATKDTFAAYLSNGEGPFLRTGDLGFIKDGQLFVTGRIKDLIIIRGRNHYPQDIELTVEKSSAAIRSGLVAACAVDIDGQERLIVIAEVERSLSVRKRKATEDTNKDFQEIVDAIRQEISVQHQLQVYGIVLIKTGSIPKTSSGKIQRHACKNGFLNSSLDVVFSSILDHKIEHGLSTEETIESNLAITDEIAAKVIGILQEAMAEIGVVSRISLNSTLQSHLGLDSLGLVELAAKLESVFGIKLDEQNLPLFHNVGDLVEAVRSAVNSKNIREFDNNDVKPALTDDFLMGDRAEKLPPPRGFLTRLALSNFRLISKVVWDLDVTGLEYLPEYGPFILCPNHESHLDVFWVASCLNPSQRNSLISFAKKEHFENPSTRLLAGLAGAIPIDRQGDVLPAMRAGHTALQAGRPLLIHPEGTRTRTGELLPFRRGPAKLALATGAPLIPVRIIGAYSIFPPHRRLPKLFMKKNGDRRKLKIVFGAPIMPPKDQQGWAAEKMLTDKLRQAVEALGD